jgi:hypothetical protein
MMMVVVVVVVMVMKISMSKFQIYLICEKYVIENDCRFWHVYFTSVRRCMIVFMVLTH